MNPMQMQQQAFLNAQAMAAANKKARTQSSKSSSKTSSATAAAAAQSAQNDAAIAGAKSKLAMINNERDDKTWIGATTKVQSAAQALSMQQQQQQQGLDFNQVVQQSIVNVGLNPKEIENQCLQALLEHARSFAWNLVADAQDYCYHRTNDLSASISGDDLMLAVQNRNDVPAYAGSGSRRSMADQLNAMYETEINVKPLPNIPQDCYTGVVLPPPEHSLLARTYDIVPGVTGAGAGSKSSSSGAGKSRQKKSSTKSKKKVLEINIKSGTTGSASANASDKAVVGAGASTTSGTKRKADSVS